MYKILKTALPAAQLLIAGGTFAWYSLGNSVAAEIYAYPARDIVIKINFPVALFWSPILYVMEHFSGYLSPSSEVTRAVSLVLWVIAFALSIVLFWYFMMVEIEMRIQKKSIIRFTNWFAEACKDLVFFAVGTGAIVIAVFEANRLWHPSRSETDAVIGGLFLLAWGILLIATSILDIAFFIRRGRHAAPPLSAS